MGLGIPHRSTIFNDRGRLGRYTGIHHFLYFLIRVVGAFDLVTDILLFRFFVINDDPKVLQESLFFATIILFSITAPCDVLSFSSGVQLFNAKFDETEGIHSFLIFFYVLPSGILYWAILDILDMILSLVRLVLLWGCFGYNHKSIKVLEDMWPNQIGMDRMSWEGFKRQKVIAQITFKNLPQITLQLSIYLLVSNFNLQEENNQFDDTQFQYLLFGSLAAAVLNGMLQFGRIYLEAGAVKEPVVEYALNCAMDRVRWGKSGWTPLGMALNLYKKEKDAKLEHQQQEREKLEKSNAELLQKSNGMIGASPVLPVTPIKPKKHKTKSHAPVTIDQVTRAGAEQQLRLQTHQNVEYMFNFGSSLNDSICQDQRISPLWFAFSKGGDPALIKDLIKRGCRLNTSEVSQLSHYYVEAAIKDAKHILNAKSYYKSRHDNREVLKEVNYQGLSNLNLFQVSTSPAGQIGVNYRLLDRVLQNKRYCKDVIMKALLRENFNVNYDALLRRSRMEAKAKARTPKYTQVEQKCGKLSKRKCREQWKKRRKCREMHVYQKCRERRQQKRPECRKLSKRGKRGKRASSTRASEMKRYK